MISPPSAPADVGAQTPRVWSVPDTAVSSAGEEAIELARMAGLEPDPWQQFVIHEALGERRDGQWAAMEVGVEVPRQNGKGGIVEIRELAGLFLLGEGLQTYTAHQFDTSLEAFRRLWELIESTPDLDRRVRKKKESHGEEGIELRGGQRIRFRTRTKGGGRGFSGDTVYLDEAMEISEASHGALFPTMSARPNPQLWYLGSAVDQLVHQNGVVFARIRERGIKGDDPSLAYFSFSYGAEHPDEVTPAMARDPRVWAQANPALGIRISREYVTNEQRSMAARTFAAERLGVGDWPDTDEHGERKIDPDAWAKLFDRHSQPKDPVAFAFDVTPDRSAAAIGAAGDRLDGKTHLELVDHRRGTGWVVKRLVELVRKHGPRGIVLDATGPAGALLPKLAEALALAELEVEVRELNSKEHAQACGMLVDLVDQDQARHLGADELTAAVDGAVSRTLGDAWAWARRRSTVDISPLVSVTLANFGLETIEVRQESVGVVY